jgi:hypothetical protein
MSGSKMSDPNMSDSTMLNNHALKYRGILQEYYQLCSRTTLNDLEADRIQMILNDAQADPLLSFLIDEADHMLAHQHHLIDDSFIVEQQEHLKNSLDQVWVEELLVDAKVRYKDSQRKDIQHFLREKGFYKGSIDGDCGPKTQAAFKEFSATERFDQSFLPIHESSSLNC